MSDAKGKINRDSIGNVLFVAIGVSLVCSVLVASAAVILKPRQLLNEEEFHRISSLRRAMADVSPVDSMDDLVKRLRKTQNNAEFLLSVKDVD